jgi:hypothetical protein
MSVPFFQDPVRVLRTVLVADALAAAAMGLLLLLVPGVLLDLLGLPAWLTRPAGISLLPFAAFVAWTATRPQPPRPAVWAIVALNAAWAAESVVTLAGGFVPATGLGAAFVLLQAAAVAAFGLAEAAALRQVPRLA